MAKSLQVLRQEFNVNSIGIITNAGKFEGESLATPYYYEIMLDGEGNVIEITEDDRLALEIEDKYNYVVVFESNDGFVSLGWYETKETAEEVADNDYVGNAYD